MTPFRPEMKKLYYDSTKYNSYPEQLGIQYPTLRNDRQAVPQQEYQENAGRRLIKRIRTLFCGLMPRFVDGYLVRLRDDCVTGRSRRQFLRRVVGEAVYGQLR